MTTALNHTLAIIIGIAYVSHLILTLHVRRKSHKSYIKVNNRLTQEQQIRKEQIDHANEKRRGLSDYTYQRGQNTNAILNEILDMHSLQVQKMYENGQPTVELIKVKKPTKSEFRKIAANKPKKEAGSGALKVGDKVSYRRTNLAKTR